MLGYAILGLVILTAIYVLAFYNGTIKLRNAVEEGFATMDVYLKKRYDMIPNLVETVKGYAAHEQETLQALTEARSRSMQATTPEDRIEREGGFQSALKSLFAVAENYPELKANQNFLSLQAELSSTEADIANARKYYNAVVKQFNTRIQLFPGSLLAPLFGFHKQAMFEVGAEAERENVAVRF